MLDKIDVDRLIMDIRIVPCKGRKDEGEGSET